jgi:hypothetical protein
VRLYLSGCVDIHRVLLVSGSILFRFRFSIQESRAFFDIKFLFREKSYSIYCGRDKKKIVAHTNSKKRKQIDTG